MIAPSSRQPPTSGNSSWPASSSRRGPPTRTVLPSTRAVTPTAGDELKSVDGNVTIGTIAQPAKGALWGQMDNGRLTIVDPVVGDGAVFVSGWDTRVVKDDDPKTIVYTGHDLHYRVTGGKYKLAFVGYGIDLTAVGVGVAYLDGDDQVPDPGYYARDSGKWTPVPVFLVPRLSLPVSFGTPTPPDQTP